MELVGETYTKLSVLRDSVVIIYATHREMLFSVARRGLNIAAAEHAQLFQMADGGADHEQLKRTMLDQQIKSSYTLPRGGDHVAIGALAQDEGNPFSSANAQTQMAVSPASVEAHLIQTAGFDSETVYANLNAFAIRVSPRGRGFVSSQLVWLQPVWLQLV